MAIDVVLSGPAQVAVDIDGQSDLEIDMLPAHRLGQHEDVDATVLTAGYVVTRKTDGTFDLQAGSGGSGDMTAAVYDAAGITQQLAGLSATQTLTNKSIVATQINSGTLPDARIQVSGVTQHQASINHTVIMNSGVKSHATIDAHIDATAAHGATGAVVGTTNSQTLVNKTLTIPTIGSFVNATHDHEDNVGGGTLDFSALSNLHIGITPPGSPTNGDLYMQTNDGVLYYWDNGRSKWLSTHQDIFLFGKNGDVGVDEYLRGPGNVLLDGDPGYLMAFHYTITGYSWSSQASPDLEGAKAAIRRTSDPGGVTINVTSWSIHHGDIGDNHADHTLNVNFQAAGLMSIRIEDIEVGSDVVVAPVCAVYMRRRTF